MLPLVGRSTEETEAGFQTLLHALRRLFDMKIAGLPEGELQRNRQQYVDEVVRKALEREIQSFLYYVC
jgi:hypothetical protein